MKSFAARLSVVALAVAGFTASTVVSYAATKDHKIKPVVVGPTSPCPMCGPHNPAPCGLD